MTWSLVLLLHIPLHTPGVFGITQESVEAMRDGETDATGMLWHVHIRDRLPMDILPRVSVLSAIVQ